MLRFLSVNTASIDLGKDPVPVCFRHYLVPAILGMAIKAIYVLADLMFIGQTEGSKGLAAINIAIPYFTFMSAIAMSIGVGGSAIMAIRFGQNRKQEGLALFQQSLFLTAIIMLIMTLFSLLFLSDISRLFGANEELLPMVNDYLGVLTLFAVPYAIGWVLASFIRNDGNPKLVMVAMTASALSNVFLDWLFLFPFGWGMKGAALATGIAQLAMVTTLLLHFKRPNIQLTLNSALPTWSQARAIIVNGIPTFIMESANGFVVMASNWVLLSLGGNLFISAYTIALNCNWVVIMLAYGVTQAAQPIISFNHGAEHTDRIMSILRLALGLVIVIGGMMTAFMVFFAENIVSLFVNEAAEELLSLSGYVLGLYALSIVPLGVSLITVSLYQSIARSRCSTVISLLRALILPLLGLFFLPVIFNDDSVWLNFLLAEALTALLSLYFLRRYWLRKQNHQPELQLHNTP
ncbi:MULTISPECIES: MATE family efflux transporter [unclassified Endozoicomonas]|uniref:MATE family efflux transporter n=1 Tax=Endozoicomonas sp. SESOKO3 TaxID=2828744 RepID=UPI002147EABC|nr:MULTISPECIES: MATE family efflux transporter [unclassified Endozoicomonas]